MEVKRKPIIGGGVEKVVNPLCIEEGCSSFDPVNRVPFLEQKFGEVRTILSGDSSDKNRVLRVVIGISS